MEEAEPRSGGPQIASVRDLALQLKIAKADCEWRQSGKCTGAVFLVGAGCSHSAGIPLAGEIAQELTLSLAKTLAGPADRSALEALGWLSERQYLTNISQLPNFDVRTPDWGKLYGYLFEEFFRSDNKQREIIQTAIDRGDGKINWAHICLGELVRRHYVHTVLTTNFDQLVLQGVILTGIIPVIADGLNALNRVSSRPEHPQVVHLHGSMYTYGPRNSLGDTGSTKDALPMQGTMYGLLHDAELLVVVGYSGGEEGVISLLRAACEAFSNLMVFWILYDDSPEALSDPVREMLSGRNKFVITGQDADAFFAELARALDFGAPTWVTDPLSALQARVDLFAETKDPDIDRVTRDYASRLKRFRDAPGLPDEGAVIEKATIDSLGGQDQKVVDELSAEIATSDPDAARLLAISLGRLGKLKQAPDLLERSAQTWRSFLERVGEGDGRALRQLAETLLDLAESAEDAKDPQAQNGFKQAIASFLSAAEKLGPSDFKKEWIEAVLGLADALAEHGDEGAGEHELTLGVEILDRLVAGFPDGHRAPRRLRALDKLGVLLTMRGRITHSTDDLRRAIGILEEATRDSDGEPVSWAVGIRRNLAVAYRGLGELTSPDAPDEAEAHLRKAAEFYFEAASAYAGGLRDVDEAAARSAAIYTYEEAEKLFGKLGDEEQRAACQLAIADLRS